MRARTPIEIVVTRSTQLLDTAMLTRLLAASAFRQHLEAAKGSSLGPDLPVHDVTERSDPPAEQ